MPPLDDELRVALSRRAAALDPSPDPMAGVERRARGLRRTRVATAVGGSVVALAVVAAGGALLLPAGDAPPPSLATAASASPTAVPDVTTPEVVAPTSYALDPADPWAFRGDALALKDGNDTALEREWQVRHPGSEVTPLFAQVVESSQQLEVVFVASSPTEDRWGVATFTEVGPDFSYDEPLDGDLVLVAALPGRVVAVADPRTTLDTFAPPGTVLPSQVVRGPGTITYLGEMRFSVAVTAPDGTLLVSATTPEPVGPAVEEPELPALDGSADAASYGLDLQEPWAFRGDPAVAEALRAEADALFGAARGPSTTYDLYAAASDGGVRYLVQQRSDEDGVYTISTTWQRGDRAAEQSYTPVEQGQALLQLEFENDLDDETTYLVLLADPRSVLEVVVDGFPFIAGEGVYLDGARLPGRTTTATLTTATGETYLTAEVP